MPSAQDHKYKAETLLDDVAETLETIGLSDHPEAVLAKIAVDVARAQVHATLATVVSPRLTGLR